MPELSVVIVAGLRLDALKLCLANLKLATAHPAEWVVVLCNATKELKAWVRAEAKNDPALSVYEPKGKPDVYACYNYGVEKARAPVVCLTNDDMLFCEDWDEFSLPQVEDDMLMTGVVVEPGVVGVDKRNVKFDLGRTPAEFDAEKFKGIVEAHRNARIVKGEQGWFMPVLFTRDSFLKTGGYKIDPPFPSPNDVEFFAAWVKGGRVLAQSHDIIVYHFQRLSQRPKSRLWWGKEYRDGYVNLLDTPTSDLDLDHILEDGFPTEYAYVYVDGDVLEEFAEIDDVLMRLWEATGEVLDIEFDGLRGKLNNCRQATDAQLYDEGELAKLFGTEDQPKRTGFTATWLRAQLEAVGFTTELTNGHLHQYKMTARK